MNDGKDERLERLLRSGMHPVGDQEPRRDLWPEMLRRIQEGSRREPFGALDWALTGLVAATLLVFPRLIPALLYQL